MSSGELHKAAPEAVRIKLTIAYDGKAYAGWQMQKVGLGVQQVIEEAFQKIFHENFRLHSSSRTDTGVHALAMIAHVDLPKSRLKMTLQKLPLALNAYLPEDIRIVNATRVRADFHARFDAAGKQYRYFVWNDHCHNPLWRHQTWLVPQKLDLKAMRQGAASLVGKHDFASFAGTRDYKMESTVRNLTRCEIRKSGPLITFIFEADGFLYRMCRGLAGTLVQVGQGKFQAGELRAMIESKDRRVGGMTAPAHGLVLWKVFYKKKSDAHRPA